MAQSLHETGGSFPGNVKEWFYNTAGIKVRHPDEVRRIIASERYGIPLRDVSGAQLESISPDHPLCHQMNCDFVQGAEIHSLHLLEWCGFPAAWSEHMDPRARAVRSLLPSKGPATTWQSLSTRWAPSLTYGPSVYNLMLTLCAP